MLRKKVITIISVLAVVLSASSALFAQEAGGSRDSYYPDFGSDADMELSVEGNSFSTRGVQYGGWVTPAMMYSSEQELTLSATVLKLWARAYLWNNAYIYVRAKDILSVPVDNDAYDTENILDLDVAFLDMSFMNERVRVTLGRKYFIVGSGLVLNDRGDGGELDIFSSYVNFKAFASYTGLLIKDYNPYNLSSADISDGSERLFAGGVLSSNYYNHQIYLFGMAQVDLSGDENDNYDSQYYGAGFRGVLGSAGYHGEFVYETGESYTSAGEKADIKAMAVTAGFDYMLDLATSPVLMLQYAYGSGDGDRSDTVSSAGNVSGNDENFISFGTFLAGYGLNPSIGNLHVLRAGFSLQPTSMLDSLILKRTTLVAKYSYYMKDNSAAPIKAGEASLDDSFVGQGLDLSLRWKIFSDMSFFVSYGLFIPGSAYDSSESNRHFTMAGLNISF